MPFAPPVTIAVRPSSLAMIACTPDWHPRETLGQCVGRDATHERRRHGNANDRSTAQDKLAIRELIENWAVWRDSLQWDRFRTVWHPEGRMMATWFQGTVRGVHRGQPGGLRQGRAHLRISSAAPRSTSRASAPSRRPRCRSRSAAAVEGVDCDVVCIGRFYDFLEKRKGQWGLVLRRRSTRRTSIDPVDPAQGAEARPEAAGALPGRLPPPRLSADQDRLQGEERHAGGRSGPSSTRSTHAARRGLPASRKAGPEHASFADAARNSPTIDHSVTRITRLRRRGG